MKIDKEFLDRLSDEAKQSPRLRKNYDLRTGADDTSQRMLNALEPGTCVPIHRHRKSTETLVVVRGSLRELFYDENGELKESVELSAHGDCSALQIEKGRWHSLECLEPGTVTFEAKDGAYEPMAKEDMLE